MIITCPSCKKKFNIDINLIPDEGRDLQCGSCEHVWFYKKQDTIPEPLKINENFVINETEESDKINDDKSNAQALKQSVKEDNEEKSELLATKKTKNKSKVIKKTKSSKFFSYSIVLSLFLKLILVL